MLADETVTEEDKRQARTGLFGLLEVMAGWAAEPLVSGVVQLAETVEDKRQARDALLDLLASQTNARAREMVLGLLAAETDALVAAQWVSEMAELDPTTEDLTTWQTWPSPPSAALLAAVRRNSTLTAWLAALPSLALLSG